MKKSTPTMSPTLAPRRVALDTKGATAAAKPPRAPRPSPRKFSLPGPRAGPYNCDKLVCDLLLSFFQKTQLDLLRTNEKELVADVRCIVQRAIAERDDAIRELGEVRDRVERTRQFIALGELASETPTELSSTKGIQVPDPTPRSTAPSITVEVETKPMPTMWQLLVASHANHPDLAAALEGLEHDPALAALHEIEQETLVARLRDRLRVTERD